MRARRALVPWPICPFSAAAGEAGAKECVGVPRPRCGRRAGIPSGGPPEEQLEELEEQEVDEEEEA